MMRTYKYNRVKKYRCNMCFKVLNIDLYGEFLIEIYHKDYCLKLVVKIIKIKIIANGIPV